MNALPQSTIAYKAIRDRIIALEAGIDEATLSDTLEGVTDLHEVLAAVVRTALVEEAMAEGLKTHIKTLQDRLERLSERASARRRIARDVMLEVDLKKVAAPDFTIIVRPGSPSVVVVDEQAVPEAYWEAREPRLDRAHLLSDLKLGASIAGVQLSNPEPVLSVRIR
jgi:Gp157 protein